MSKAYIFTGIVNKVVDGDTYDVILDLGFSITHRIRVRLKGVDTPEIFGANSSEAGKSASEYVKKILDGKLVTVQTYKNAPSTYNRWEADVYFTLLKEDGSILNTGVSLAEHLVKEGYAKKV